MKSNLWIHSLLIFLIYFTVVAADCPDNGNCDTCEITLSASVKSTNDTIWITQQENITLIVNFSERGHNGFTFAVNDRVFHPDIKNRDFTCTSEMDTPNLTQTLEVQYHCTAVEPGNYRIEAYVYYCGRDYYAQTITVMVENAASPSPSLTMLLMLSTSFSSMQPTRPPMPSMIPSTAMSITPTASSSGILTNASTFMSPSSTTGIDVTSVSEGNNTVVIVTCVSTGLILAAVLIVILLMYFKKVPKTVFCCSLKQRTRGNQETPYDSETSNETNETNFTIPTPPVVRAL